MRDSTVPGHLHRAIAPGSHSAICTPAFCAPALFAARTNRMCLAICCGRELHAPFCSLLALATVLRTLLVIDRAPRRHRARTHSATPQWCSCHTTVTMCGPNATANLCHQAARPQCSSPQTPATLHLWAPQGKKSQLIIPTTKS